MRSRGFTFDLDDTLVDTSDVIFKTFNDSLQEFGAGRIGSKKYKALNFWSGDPESVIRELGVEAGLREFMARYNQLYLENTEEYIEDGRIYVLPGVKNLLEREREKGNFLGLVTNSPHETAELKMDRMGLRKYFDKVITPQHVSEKKPHPEGIKKVVKSSGLEKSVFWHVGDSSTDLEAARNAGVKSVLVTEDVGKGMKADLHVESPAGLLEAISKKR